jgi:TonB family protein
LAAASLAAGLALPAADLAAQQARVPAGRWVVDYAQARCSLARRLGDERSPVFLLGTFLGGEGPQIVLIEDGDRTFPSRLPARVQVALLPSQAAVELPLVQRPLRIGRSILIEGLSEAFIDQFAQATSVQIRSGQRVLFDIPVPNSRRGVEGLKACNDDLLRTWGIDPEAQARLQRPARRPPGPPVITDADFPSDALVDGHRGTVVMRVAIDPEGRPIDCTPVESSGSPVLDQQSCRLLLQRARWEPALDARGQPTATSVVQRVIWRNPD